MYTLAKVGVIRHDPERDPQTGTRIWPDISNSDWLEYLAWVAAGNAPAQP